jgi:hypothetical protein
MKIISFGIVLFSAALCALLLLCPPKGYAETVTLTLESVGGQSSGANTGVYVYPYNFSINGSTTTTPLMCISYENEVYIGESWQATLVPVTGTQYVEAAYIFSLANASGASAKTIAEAQWANWELFDPNDQALLGNLPTGYQGDINNMLLAALAFAQTDPRTSQFANFSIFIPVDGTQPNGDDIPQTFFGDPPNFGGPPDAPEPSSYLLLGTGMLGLAFLGFRKRYVA